MLPLVFIAIAAMTLVGAIGVVTARNLFHAALFLVLSFFGVAGVFITLEAEFLGVVQVLIYVGAISILIIFAIMLSRGIARTAGAVLNAQWPFVAVGAMLLFALLVVLLLQVNWPVVQVTAPPNVIAELGRAFVDEYVIPFEVASVLLVVALIGAIIIARERES